MEQIRGQIRWQHVARSRAIRKIVERGIARWAESHVSGDAPGASVAVEGSFGGFNAGDDPRFDATLERQGDGHLVHCEIKVVAGDRAWVGSRVGQGIQQALADCLSHMRVVPVPA